MSKSINQIAANTGWTIAIADDGAEVIAAKTVSLIANHTDEILSHGYAGHPVVQFAMRHRFSAQALAKSIALVMDGAGAHDLYTHLAESIDLGSRDEKDTLHREIRDITYYASARS